MLLIKIGFLKVFVIVWVKILFIINVFNNYDEKINFEV